MLRRYAAATAAGAAIAVSLTGCNGDSGGKANAGNVSAAQALDLASKKTASVDSYKVDLTAGGSGKAAGKAHGAIQVRLRPNIAATGTLDEASFGSQSLPGGERAVLLNNFLYVRLPQQATQFSGGKPWVKFSLAKAGQQAGTNVDQMLKQANPAEQTKIFTGSKNAQMVGTQSINGEKTTHYRGTITAKDAEAKLDPKTRKSFQDFYQKAGAMPVNFDLWVGKDNLPRKLVTKMAAKEGAVTATMIFSDYNKSFNVSAPPANQVADGDQLKQSFQQFGGQHH